MYFKNSFKANDLDLINNETKKIFSEDELTPSLAVKWDIN